MASNTVGQANIPVSQNTQTSPNVSAPLNAQNPQNLQVPNYSGVNIQIFNPSVAAPGGAVPPGTVNAQNYSAAGCYPQNYYTQNLAQPTAQPVKPQTEEPEKKKTEKREIVQLTDDYIKNLEMYLNNPDKAIRVMGAKAVLARLQEDPSRKEDAALNALVNKMLQDPSQSVRFIAMAALEAGNAAGNAESVKLLQNIQAQSSIQKDPSSNEDALKASNVLLKMSGNKVKKEFEAENKAEKKDKKGVSDE